MLKKLLLAASGSCLLLAANAPLVMAQERAETLKVGLWGDQFYSKDAAEKAQRTSQTIESMNAHKLNFTMYAGDTKNGSSECSDKAIGDDIISVYNRLDMPTLYTLGDNEWTDCHRTSNGAYDPLERLSFLRKTFFNKATTQGKSPIAVERQGELGEAYSENSRFVASNVEFVALAVTGSNNNLVVTEKQCTKKSKRSAEDCAAASEEYKARNAKNIEWLKESFAKAKQDQLAGIAIIIQADIFFPFELSDGGYEDDFMTSLDDKNGFTDFFKTLISETQSYDGQVVLINGDSHFFKMDKPMYNPNGQLTANFTRVQVFGEEDNSWIEMTVNPASETVFTFSPVMLN
ncbi:hypothetical protein SAMN03080615_02651 [Amphritea atlantica]|uniref:Calcineurin-like phosphoesterase n=1 Tax=Amphritea atlantica TaxID=355243 RepID=A0A1H9IMP2_9GAMM|nr:hypothetical protein [Amphritea atlantica]SEQ75777.1 hypothetical protein SAMN03080615_02651 [Amphritea atlantica]